MRSGQVSIRPIAYHSILVIYHNDAGRIGELVKELIKEFDLYSTTYCNGHLLDYFATEGGGGGSIESDFPRVFVCARDN